MTEDELILHHHSSTRRHWPPDEEEEGAAIPPMPVIENPGYFVIGEKWKEGEIAWNRETHSQQLQSFLWKTNIEQAVNLKLTNAIPKALLSDYTDDEGTLTANVTLILDHNMEETYDKIHPKDINNIMKTFNTEFDSTTTLSIYFDWQQGCKKLLRTTKEPILTAIQWSPPLSDISSAYHTWEMLVKNGESMN